MHRTWQFLRKSPYACVGSQLHPVFKFVLIFNVITFIASLLRGTTQENMTSQRERTVGEMT